MYGVVNRSDTGMKNIISFLFTPSSYNQIIIAAGAPILPSAAHREDRRLMSHLIDTRDTDCFSSGGYEFHLHHQTTFPVEARLMLPHINLSLCSSQWPFALQCMRTNHICEITQVPHKNPLVLRNKTTNCGFP